MAQAAGYDEVNLNVGCPSDRVQRGRFGACLMLEPETVRDCVAAMQDAVEIPVTVKTRLGVDGHDSYEWFRDFIGEVSRSGCRLFIIHARKAWLSGLSPKENREIPELQYDRALRLKKEFPDLTVVLNGGIRAASDAMQQLEQFDGVMLGRAAYQSPWVLAELQQLLEPGETVRTREEVVHEMTGYLGRRVSEGVPVRHVSRHMLGLFQGLPGAKRWRRYISENAHLERLNGRLLEDALEYMQPDSAPVHGDGIEWAAGK